MQITTHAGSMTRMALATMLLGGYAISYPSAYAAETSDQSKATSNTRSVNRPDYDGTGQYKVAASADYQKQGLEELISRFGIKPYEKLKGYSRNRAIFRDINTGASIWRITDDPFGIERHINAKSPSWTCDGAYSLILLPRIVLNGDFSEEVPSAEKSIKGKPAMARDQVQPTKLYYYESKKGIFTQDLLTGESKLLYSSEKFQAAFEANKPGARENVHIFGKTTPDGQWIMGYVGEQDKGQWFFGARTDGSQLTIKKIKRGNGIHHCEPMAMERPVQLISIGTTEKLLNVMYYYDTNEYVELPQWPGAHGSWKKNDFWKVHEWEHGTLLRNMRNGETNVMLKADDLVDNHYAEWIDPDWVYLCLYSKYGSDIIMERTDCSLTAMRICSTCPAFPGYTSYALLANGASSPDATKIEYVSDMLGSIDLYVVVVRMPGAPRNLTWESAGNRVRLRWKAPPMHQEIKGYLVYRGDESGKEKVCITDKPVSDLWLEVNTPEKGKTYYYSVTSLEQSLLESNYSNETCLSGDGDTWAGAVRVFVEAEDGDMKLPLRTAMGPQVASNGYYVWQTKAGEAGIVRLNVRVPRAGKYYFAGRVSGNRFDAPWTISVNRRQGVPLNTAVAESAWKWVFWQDGSKPYAVDLPQGPCTLEFSTTADRAALDEIMVTTDPEWLPTGFGTCYEKAPAPVAGVKIKETGTYEIGLEWTAWPEQNIHHYNVYASRTPDVKADQKHLVGSPAKGPFLDWGLKPDTDYYYIVTAVDRKGNASKASSVRKGRTALHGTKIVTVESSSKTVSFDCAEKDSFMFWALVKPTKGSPKSPSLELDGKDLGEWTIVWSQEGLRGVFKPNASPAWCPYLFKPKSTTWGRVSISPGHHELKLTGGDYEIKKLMVTNDFGVRPEGILNTLYIP